MPSVPLPFITLFILLLLLFTVYHQHRWEYRRALCFIAACALLLFVNALRWGGGIDSLHGFQSALATLLPPLAWRCFATLSVQTKMPRLLASAIPACSAIVVQLCWPPATDAVLFILYAGYGVSLMLAARQGADAQIFTRISEAPTALRMRIAAGIFLCFSGLSDLILSLDFSFYHGQQAPQLVAMLQLVLLPFLCLAIISAGKTRPPLVQPGAPQAERALAAGDSDDASEEALGALCVHIEALIRERQLFLNGDLTLDLLARKAGVPARNISRAVNSTRGCNVSQWINGFRVEKAQQLLRTTGLPVSEVMLAAGFSTKSNFNREFLRISGMAPGEYRRTASDSSAPC
ncbi:AraC family transcriptional regulator [Izhakiella australiensis]|uniref:AraC family transcriptional regulator n=1 Tax=Izhakiella australiensis TaxID=1926881 RepID=A0A1S8YIJ7_9GAMM|nr:AraC family transcriptional regulator [Izhakiella australiensis]OON38880.1 AraC family transcriptional regulator [Izhakiella australiensis]